MRWFVLISRIKGEEPVARVNMASIKIFVTRVKIQYGVKTKRGDKQILRQ